MTSPALSIERRPESKKALAYIRTFTTHPHRGRPGIRTVTSRNFIFYFEVDDRSCEVSILAIFVGGADQRQQIMHRLRN